MTRLIVVAGQSNALGRCVAANVSNFPGFTTAETSIRMLDHNAPNGDPPSYVIDGPRSLSPRTQTVASLAPGTCGFEISMGKSLLAAGTGPWAISKWAIDGSNLDTQWKTDANFPTGANPNLFNQFKTYIAEQQTASASVHIGAICWQQGEADASGGNGPANYFNDLVDFFGSLRATYGLFPIVIGRLSTQFSPGTNSDIVRAAQDAFVAQTARCAMVRGDDLPLSDGTHYTDNSFATLGTRYSAAIISLTGSSSGLVGMRMGL